MKSEQEMCVEMSERLDELWIATENAKNAVKGMKGYSWKTTALFPNLYRNQDEFYSSVHFRRIKSEVEELSGVEFKLKDFRSTLTTMTVNGDLNRLNAMSVQLRHSNVATTQRSYLRMQQGVAGKQLKDAWKEHPIRTPKNPVIENKFPPTGYG